MRRIIRCRATRFAIAHRHHIAHILLHSAGAFLEYHIVDVLFHHAAGTDATSLAMRFF
jgi:hypothetical protein